MSKRPENISIKYNLGAMGVPQAKLRAAVTPAIPINYASLCGRPDFVSHALLFHWTSGRLIINPKK